MAFIPSHDPLASATVPEVYPGVHHGFAFPQRWCYDKPAAERHGERLLALSRRMPNALRGHGLPRRLA